MIPRKRIIRRTETVKDPVTQPNLLFDKQKETKEVKKTALDIMMDLQYTRIPNIYKRNPNCKWFI